jgi:hypothetical protein
MGAMTRDLTEVGGIGNEYATLLRAAGVGTCQDLAGRESEELLAHMVAVNDARHLVRRLPNIEMTSRWIEAASGAAGRRGADGPS